MKVEVVTPEEYLGSVIGDLNSRRGQIAGTDTRGNAQIVNAMVPLANMFGLREPAAFVLAGVAPATRCSSTTTKKCRRTFDSRSPEEVRLIPPICIVKGTRRNPMAKEKFET